MAQAFLRLSNSHSMNADYATATTCAEQAVEHARAAGDEALTGFALTHVATSTRDVERALPPLEAGVAALRRAGAIARIAGSLSTVAFYAIQQGEHERGARRCSAKASPPPARAAAPTSRRWSAATPASTRS